MPTVERCICGHLRPEHLVSEDAAKCLRQACDCESFTPLNEEQIAALTERLAQNLDGKMIEEVYSRDEICRIAREVVANLAEQRNNQRSTQ